MVKMRISDEDDLADARTDASNGIDLGSYQDYLDSLNEDEEPIDYDDDDWRDTREQDIPKRQ